VSTEDRLDTGDFEERAGLISFNIGGWRDFGYAKPPGPECATIPPLGERSAAAIGYGHGAVSAIDELIARLHEIRGQLVSELRRDEELRMANWELKWELRS
jgi:hypothetical protein